MVDNFEKMQDLLDDYENACWNRELDLMKDFRARTILATKNLMKEENEEFLEEMNILLDELEDSNFDRSDASIKIVRGQLDIRIKKLLEK